MENNKTKKKNKKKRNKLRCTLLLTIPIGIFLVFVKTPLLDKLVSSYRVLKLKEAELPAYVDIQLLDFDSNSRNGRNLSGFNDIVIHYVANPGTSAQANHDYFANPQSDTCSHFIIGLDGEIIQCLPLYEMSAASNWRNPDTISIEVCHPDETGKFNETTYESLIKLVAYLVDLGHLDPQENIIRHYDITEKMCPIYYVEHEDAWDALKDDVADYISDNY